MKNRDIEAPGYREKRPTQIDGRERVFSILELYKTEIVFILQAKRDAHSILSVTNPIFLADFTT
jgi:16S rRNA G966 N2-methylase RsmD